MVGSAIVKCVVQHFEIYWRGNQYMVTDRLVPMQPSGPHAVSPIRKNILQKGNSYKNEAAGNPVQLYRLACVSSRMVISTHPMQ